MENSLSRFARRASGKPRRVFPNAGKLFPLMAHTQCDYVSPMAASALYYATKCDYANKMRSAMELFNAGGEVHSVDWIGFCLSWFWVWIGLNVGLKLGFFLIGKNAVLCRLFVCMCVVFLLENFLERKMWKLRILIFRESSRFLENFCNVLFCY